MNHPYDARSESGQFEVIILGSYKLTRRDKSSPFFVISTILCVPCLIVALAFLLKCRRVEKFLGYDIAIQLNCQCHVSFRLLVISWHAGFSLKSRIRNL